MHRLLFDVSSPRIRTHISLVHQPFLTSRREILSVSSDFCFVFGPPLDERRAE